VTGDPAEELARDGGSAAEISAAVNVGLRTAAQVLADHVARHEATHARLNALVQTRHTEAAREASAGPRGPLAGVPVSVKDCFPVRGLRTTLGIPGFATACDEVDAGIVARLREAGAIIVGKGNVPQAMYLHETDNPVWGRSNHPMAADRGPGGSTGGDAALVAAGVVPLAVGNDLAGSLRNPAHVCGIATLMPRSEVLGEGDAFDTVPSLRTVRPRAGFLTRHVGDLALALKSLAPAAAAAEPVRRVGWWDAAGPIPPSAAIRRGVALAVAALEDCGVEVVRLPGEIAEQAAWLHLAIVSADGSGFVRQLFAGERPIQRVERMIGYGSLPRWTRPPVAVAAWFTGRGIEARGLMATGPRDTAGLERLLAAREGLAARFATLVAGCEALVCPASSLPALPHGAAVRLVMAAAPSMLPNLLGLAAGVVPVTTVRPAEERGRPWSPDPVLRAAATTDRGSAGLPVGVQVVAAPGRGEGTVLEVMRAIEEAVRRPS